MAVDPPQAAHEHDGTPPSVAIIDADRRVRQSLADLLSLAGLPVAGIGGTPGEAMAILERDHPSVLIVDPRLPDVDAGESLLAAVAVAHPSVRVLLMGWADAAERPGLLGGAVAYLPKAACPEEFVAATLAACGCEALA